PGALAVKVGVMAPVDHRDECAEIGQRADPSDQVRRYAKPLDDQRQEENQPVAGSVLPDIGQREEPELRIDPYLAKRIMPDSFALRILGIQAVLQPGPL